MIGLGLVAAGVYLGFVLYVGWDGGPRGRVAEEGARERRRPDRVRRAAGPRRLGPGAGHAPVRGRPGGAQCGRRPAARLPAPGLRGRRPPGWGPTHPIRHGYFEQRFFTVHGGAGGEALYWAATTLFQRLGAQILAVLMFASGLLLLTGTTVAGLMSRAGRVARTAGTGTRDLAKTVRSRRPRPRGARPARRRDRDHARRSHRAACDRDAGRRSPTGERCRPGRPAITGTGSGQTRRSRARRTPTTRRLPVKPALRTSAGRGRGGRRRRPGGRPDADGQQARRGHRVRGARLRAAHRRSCFSGARGTRART